MVVRKIRGESPLELANEFGVSRSWVYRAAELAEENAREKLEAAEREVRYRRAVVDALEATA